MLTAVELVVWGIAWWAGFAPLPELPLYIAIAFAALSVTLALRVTWTLRAPDSSWPAIICATVMIGTGASLFSAMKFSIPALVPFWLDAPIDSFERTLFGAPPWQLLDTSIGWATTFADRVYGLWLPTQLVALFSVVVARPSPAKARALTCYAAAWFLLGVVAAVLLSSVGPIFHDRAFGGARFAGLHAALLRHDAWMVVKTSDGMWSAFASGRLGAVSGISALPSMHVAISLWMALTARTLAPRMAPFAWVYFAFIWVASVQLGWHYASDGLAGCLGLAALWFVAGRLSRPRPRSQPGSAPAL